MFFLNKRSNFEKKTHELSYRSNILRAFKLRSPLCTITNCFDIIIVVTFEFDELYYCYDFRKKLNNITFIVKFKLVILLIICKLFLIYILILS